MQLRRIWYLSMIALLVSALAAPVLAAAEPSAAPVLGQDTPGALAGRFIVVFNDGAGPGAVDQAMNGLGGQVLYRYDAAVHGFAAALPEQAVQALQRNPHVAYIEADQEMQAFDAQANPTWGLDRIDQRSAGLDHTYTYDWTGAGVTAYIIDTGIHASHNDFGGRASAGYDALGGDGSDCNGHGTHVAGTVGGWTYGVAKGVTLVAVRVLDCSGSGSTSGVIAGINWVTTQKQANPGVPMVANMSLGGGASKTLDAAVKNSIAAGVSYAVAAGNGNIFGFPANACNYSPARVAEAMTVGATDSNDEKASWSNYGSCVDWFAPGVDITSAWNSSNTATETISGTSMATPHTTGVAALYLEAHPGASPRDVRDALYALTTKGIVTSSSTANNHLLYSVIDGTPPPTGGITLSVSGRTVNNRYFADLTWSGATSANVDVVRSGVRIKVTANDGAYTDNIGRTGGGTYTYKVCEAGTTTCSNVVTVSF